MDNSTIDTNCDIKDCIVGSGHTVHSNCRFLFGELGFTKILLKICVYPIQANQLTKFWLMLIGY